jgi:hypothetical protein
MQIINTSPGKVVSHVYAATGGTAAREGAFKPLLNGERDDGVDLAGRQGSNPLTVQVNLEAGLESQHFVSLFLLKFTLPIHDR